VTPSSRRLVSRLVLAAGVAALALWIAGRLEGDRGQVTWTIDASAVPAVDTIEVTIEVGDRIVAAHHGTRVAVPIRLTTPTPKGAATITIDLATADGARRVTRTASPEAGAAVAVVLGRDP
jgi:hypothetical protein